MAIFMVGYDLHEGEDYKNLTDALEKYPTWWHCLDSTWLIKSEDTAAKIRTNLRQHMIEGDSLLVMRYGKTHTGKGANASWFGFEGECRNWLSTNL
jgi:hypothetical protein